MKRYLFRILLFFVIVIFVDQLCGVAMNYVNSHAKGGATKDNYDAFNTVTADVIILGSSRAYHHYNPQIIEDSLGLTCHNCGYDGTGIINMYGRLVEICKRKVPKIVLYDVVGTHDLYEKDNIKEINGLKPYCDRDSIADIIKTVSPIEIIKLKSCLYRYNSDVFQFLRDVVMQNGIHEKGFEPMKSVMSYDPEPFVQQYKGEQPDCLKLFYFQKLIDLSKKKQFKLFFCLSPWYQANTDADFIPIISLCEKYNIKVLNFFCDSINLRKDFFADQVHLNDKGAEIYTNKVISFIRAN